MLELILQQRKEIVRPLVFSTVLITAKQRSLKSVSCKKPSIRFRCVSASVMAAFRLRVWLVHELGTGQFVARAREIPSRAVRWTLIAPMRSWDLR